MILPGQFGVYEHNTGKAILYDDMESNKEYQPLVKLVNDQANFQAAVEAIKNNKFVTRWAIHFFRNSSIDNIRHFYDSLNSGSGVEHRKDDFRKAAQISYDALKSDWFKTKLKEHNLELEPWVPESIEETYNAAKELDK